MGIKRVSGVKATSDIASSDRDRFGDRPRLRSRRSLFAGLPILGLTAGALIAATTIIVARPADAATVKFARPASLGRHQVNGNLPVLAQDDDDQDAADQVQTKQVDQYVAVYKAMQKNHGLTVDQACAQQGLTVTQFRNIENKVERDDALTALVRKALNPKDTSSADDDNDN